MVPVPVPVLQSVNKERSSQHNLWGASEALGCLLVSLGGPPFTKLKSHHFVLEYVPVGLSFIERGNNGGRISGKYSVA